MNGRSKRLLTGNCNSAIQGNISSVLGRSYYFFIYFFWFCIKNVEWRCTIDPELTSRQQARENFVKIKSIWPFHQDWRKKKVSSSVASLWYKRRLTLIHNHSHLELLYICLYRNYEKFLKSKVKNIGKICSG